MPARFVRTACVVALVALAATGARAVAEADAVGTGRRADARRARIAALDARLTALVVKASEDPRIARVDAYLALARADEFVATRRPRVAELAEYLSDVGAPRKLKERVRDALTSIPHRSLDPDLAPSEGRNRRVAFCRDRLLPLLSRPGDDALLTRTLTAAILESFWRFTDAAIQQYDPKVEATWKRATEAYRRGMVSR